MSSDAKTILERLEDLDSKQEMTLNRNGFIVLEGVEELNAEYAYSSELTDITGRSSGEIGRTLAVYEELYEIDLRYFREESEAYIWNVGRLMRQPENEHLKELLHW